MLAPAGMRPGELENGELDGERMVVIDHEEDSTWRPKTHSSYRRVFLPPGFISSETTARA